VRPLNFTVRRPLMMPCRLVWPLGLYLAFALQGCATPRVRDDVTAARQDLLLKLKRCLADVPARSPEGFWSPCARLNVSTLNGVTIAQLEANLGPHGVSSYDYVSVPKDPSAPPPPYECRWAFYRLPPNVALGGGPELQCVSSDTRTCEQVRWVLTE
jgi:hypothetical protein